MLENRTKVLSLSSQNKLKLSHMLHKYSKIMKFKYYKTTPKK